MLDTITLGVVTARGPTRRTRQSEHMNAKLPHVTKPRSRCNYAQTKSGKVLSVRLAYQAEHERPKGSKSEDWVESPEAKPESWVESPEAVSGTCNLHKC